MFMVSEKYTSTLAASVTVVNIGVAISAGSSLSFFASMGKRQPSDLAMHTVAISVSDTMAATATS